MSFTMCLQEVSSDMIFTSFTICVIRSFFFSGPIGIILMATWSFVPFFCACTTFPKLPFPSTPCKS